MDLSLTEEQKLSTESARRFLANEFPLKKLREVESAGLAAFRPVHRQMAELGFLGLGMPEDCGGSGDWLDLALYAEEAGRALVPPLQLISVVLAGHALPALGAGTDRVAKMIAGDLVVVPAVHEDGHTTREPQLEARLGERGVTGTKRFVQGLELADELLVAASDAQGKPCFALVAAKGLKATEHRLTSEERTHDVSFEDSPAIARLSGGWNHWLDAVDGAKIIAGAWSVGAARGALDMAIAYAKLREQFGRPIGSFQAVQHRLADAAMAIEQAQAMVRYAAWLRATGAECGREAAMARLVSGRAVRQATHWATLTHGGYGFMEEQDIPLYCRRAKALERLVEGPVEQRELIASQDVADMDRVR